MSRIVILLFFMILSSQCFSQISFESGFFIDNSNQRINCWIKNVDWRNNPSQFNYKLKKSGEVREGTIALVKEFGINNISKHIRHTINIDRSSENVNKLSKEKSPLYNEEKLFLKVLVEGEASLYLYRDGNLKRFFYDSENKNTEQLVFKSYKNP